MLECVATIHMVNRVIREGQTLTFNIKHKVNCGSRLDVYPKETFSFVRSTAKFNTGRRWLLCIHLTEILRFFPARQPVRPPGARTATAMASRASRGSGDAGARGVIGQGYPSHSNYCRVCRPGTAPAFSFKMGDVLHADNVHSAKF